MAISNLTCPLCGFSKDVDKTRIPKDGSKVTCPKCQFVFYHQEPSAETAPVPIQVSQALTPDNKKAPPRLIICNVCFAENNFKDLPLLNCYNCGNEFQEQLPKSSAAKSTSATEVMAMIYTWLCYVPYVVALIGFIAVSKAVGEHKLVIVLYAYVFAGILAFNSIAGIPLMFIEYRTDLKLRVVSTYMVCVVLPVICLFAFIHV